jgi:hypothetical protein
MNADALLMDQPNNLKDTKRIEYQSYGRIRVNLHDLLHEHIPVYTRFELKVYYNYGLRWNLDPDSDTGCNWTINESANEAVNLKNSCLRGFSHY